MASVTTKNQVTLRERLSIAEFIKANTEPDGEHHVKWIDPIADDAAAARRLSAGLGRQVTAQNVRSTRLSICGRLRTPGASPEALAKARAARFKAKRGRKPAIDGAAIVGAINDLRAEISDLRAALEQSGDITMASRRLALAGE